MLEDLRYALRQLGNRPAFTITAVLSLAFGLGANAAIFSLGHALLLSPMPVPGPGEMVHVYNGQHSPFSLADFEFLSRRLDSTVTLIGEQHRAATMQAEGDPERVTVSVTAGDYWRTLGISPQLGTFVTRARDDVSGAEPQVVLSDRFWRRRFAADPAIIGRSIRVGVSSAVVAGVAGPGFTGSLYGFTSDLWIPLSDAVTVLGAPAASLGSSLYVTGRLRPGVTRDQAQGRLDVVVNQLQQSQPETRRRRTARVEAAHGITAELRNPVMLVSGFLLAVTVLVLLTACANVGNLLLAHNATRRVELGVRVAMGAGRRRIVRQLLTESLVLAVCAGAIALFFASWVGDVLALLVPDGLPVSIPVPVDAMVVGYGAGISLLAVLAFGLAPAMRAIPVDVAQALRGGARSVVRGGRGGQRFLLVQVTLSTVLLAVALLFVRSLGNARHLDPGFDTSGLVAMDVDLGPGEQDRANGIAFFDHLVERLRALPFARGVSVAATVPLAGTRLEVPWVRAGDPPPSPDERPTLTDFGVVGTGYFAMSGIGVLRGREFVADDRTGAPLVAIVNQTMARRLAPGGDALGRRLSLSGADGPFAEVVGIVRDVRYNALNETTPPFVYVPFAQNFRPEMQVEVRLDPSAPFGTASRAIAGVLAAANPTLPPAQVRRVDDLQRIALLPARVGAGTVGAFGVLALMLAAVGIFGVSAFSVAQRTREIGIRSALGASASALLRTVLGDTVKTVVIGGIAGSVLAIAAQQLIRSQLYGVGAIDPVTFVGVPLVLATVAALAAAVPARRAIRVDPAITLQAE